MNKRSTDLSVKKTIHRVITVIVTLITMSVLFSCNTTTTKTITTDDYEIEIPKDYKQTSESAFANKDETESVIVSKLTFDELDEAEIEKTEEAIYLKLLMANGISQHDEEYKQIGDFKVYECFCRRTINDSGIKLVDCTMTLCIQKTDDSFWIIECITTQENQNEFSKKISEILSSFKLK